MKKIKHKNFKININLNKLMGVLSIIVACYMFIKLLIPLCLFIMEMFSSLLVIYASLTDINFKFIGLCFFIVIYWIIFSIFCLIFYEIIKVGYKTYLK